MKIWLPALALGVAFTIGAAIPSADAMGGGSAGAPAHAMGGFHGQGFGFHHGFASHPRFFRPFHPSHRQQPDFGAGFASHQSNVLAGGYGDTSDDSYSNDDIEDLHFRVQEPFGPGDIGRPPASAEEDAPYMSEGTDPGPGYAPER